MKKSYYNTILGIIIQIATFSLFTVCEDPNRPDPIPKYTVSFEANGGNPAPENQVISRGGKVTEPAPVYKYGYIFGGWYKEKTCTNLWNFTVDTVTGKTTLYAKWDINFYTVDFNEDDGSPGPQQQSIAFGGKIAEPLEMSKNGYTFGGWYKEETLTNLWNFTTNTVSGNTTLYAQWLKNFTVTFETDGGSPNPEQQIIASSRKVTEPPIISKTGYTFGGWYKEAALSNQWNFISDTITGDITLYAKWLENFTVTFEADGGSPEPEQQVIADGGKVSESPTVSKLGYKFGGWYKEELCLNVWDYENDVVTGNLTLYAQWGTAILVPGASFNAKMRWLETNAQSDGNYIIEFYADESIGSTIISYSGKNNITITLKGIETIRNIDTTNGQMFSIGSGVTIILDNNLELRRWGSTTDYMYMISVNSGGGLIVNSGVKITEKTTSNSFGGGVYVSRGTFTMNGGEISGYTSHNDGSGVYVSRGTFTMNGGEISGNKCSKIISHYVTNNVIACGGGVYVGSNGTFTMNGGSILNNTVIASSVYTMSYSFGGGVYLANNGTFTMNNGEISGNIAHYSGGGVYVGNYGTFTMSDGTISNNSSSSNGGGVYSTGTFTMSDGTISNNSSSSGNGGGVCSIGTFTMNDGTISNNSSSYDGGGVYSAGTFTMNDGEISGNSARNGGSVYSAGTFTMSGGEIAGNTVVAYSYWGGGVYVNGRYFNKIGGTIFGYSDGDSNSNVVKNSSGVVQPNRGHAVHVNHSNSIYIMGRDTTSGPEDNLSFNGIVTPPTYSGEWDY